MYALLYVPLTCVFHYHYCYATDFRDTIAIQLSSTRSLLIIVALHRYVLCGRYGIPPAGGERVSSERRLGLEPLPPSLAAVCMKSEGQVDQQ